MIVLNGEVVNEINHTQLKDGLLKLRPLERG